MALTWTLGFGVWNLVRTLVPNSVGGWSRVFFHGMELTTLVVVGFSEAGVSIRDNGSLVLRLREVVLPGLAGT